MLSDVPKFFGGNGKAWPVEFNFPLEFNSYKVEPFVTYIGSLTVTFDVTCSMEINAELWGFICKRNFLFQIF